MNCLGLLWDAGSLFGAKHYEPHLFAEENAAPVVFDVTCEDCLRVYRVHVDFQTQEALDEFNYRHLEDHGRQRAVRDVTMSSPITPHHLGGHMGVTHTDEGALRELMGISPTSRAFIDIGCGPGRQVQLASLAGLHAYGIDGDPALRGSDSWVALPQSFLCMDLTDPDSAALSDFLPNTNTAIGWSVEFLEHLEEQYLPNLIDVFCRCSIVAVTAAPPGHLGHHHVNLQSEDYWVSKFEDLFGLTHDPALTQRVRNASTMGRAFMRCQGLVFVQS